MANKPKRKLTLPPPSDTQWAFMRAKSLHVGFGGARGGGKSWAVRTNAELLAAHYPGIRQLIVRRTYPELVNNHINQMRADLVDIAKYNDTEKVFKFINGSTINFAYCAKDGDLDRLQGVQYDIIYLDEATQLSEYQMKTITACLRGVNNFPKRIYYTMNPGGQGHNYIKRIFVDRRYEVGEKPEDYTFIQSLVTDNKVLMEAQPDYIKQLEALPEKLKEAWLYGRWDIFQGQFFEEFRTTPDLGACQEVGLSPREAKAQHRFTHVIAPFDLNEGQRRDWPIFRSYDFGYARPFSCGWWTVDYEGTIYRILELYGCSNTPNEGVKWTPDKQFTEIAKMEREHPWLKDRKITGVADPAIWDASRGESVAEMALRHGVYFTPGDNHRIAGWMQVRYRMQFDRQGYARFYVFENCRDFIRTLPELQFSDNNPEDLNTEGEDHIADEFRYFCMSRPIKPVRTEMPGPLVIDPLSEERNYIK